MKRGMRGGTSVRMLNRHMVTLGRHAAWRRGCGAMIGSGETGLVRFGRFNPVWTGLSPVRQTLFLGQKTRQIRFSPVWSGLQRGAAQTGPIGFCVSRIHCSGTGHSTSLFPLES